MLNVLLLGATGTAGSALAEKLMADTDCHVTLFARHMDGVKAEQGNVTVVSGDAAKASDLKGAMERQDVVEASSLNYTILRPGFLQDGDEDDFVLTLKGEAAKGYVTTIPSVIKLAVSLIHDETLYARESVSITKDMSR